MFQVSRLNLKFWGKGMITIITNSIFKAIVKLICFVTT